MPRKATLEDLSLARHFRSLGILADVEGHLLDHSDGAITVVCADGDQLSDLFARHSLICGEQRENARVHQFSLNGGALLIPVSSPLVDELPEGDVLVKHIVAATGLKGIKTIVLYAHLPCGAAYGKRLSLLNVLELLVQAKERVKHALKTTPDSASMALAAFMHIDWGDSTKRTYFFDRKKWDKWRADGMPEAISSLPPPMNAP